jgi:23S rRNA (adenine2503-C2)-methyltransferase
MTQILKSKQDLSVNFISKEDFEVRFVRREDDTVIIYLSSHNGCNQACRMCHLTQTGQTSMTEATTYEMVRQAVQALAYYNEQIELGNQKPAKELHFNWMARGDPLMNLSVCQDWNNLSLALAHLGYIHGFDTIKFKISTIFPKDGYEPRWFGHKIEPEIYYSLYSVKEEFRKRWLPKAISTYDAAERLNDIRQQGGKVTIHSCFIAGENDHYEDMDRLVNWLFESNLLDVDFNIVRYNPYSYLQGKESDEDTLRWIEHRLNQFVTGRVQLVPRVGFDVKASCGMFVDNFNWKFGNVVAMPSQTIKLYPGCKTWGYKE